MNTLKRIGFWCAFTVPLVTVLGFYGGGWWNFSTIFYVFVWVPLLDEIVGKDKENVIESEEKALASEKYFKYVTFAWVLAHFSLIFWGFYVLLFTSLLLYEKIGLLLSISLSTGGLGITIAHELGHKHTKTEQFLSKILLITVFYMHFFVEHNRGHHIHVGTEADPATSRFGENFYSFWWRTVSGGFLSAWSIEKTRLSRKNISAFSLENDVLKGIIYSVIFMVLLCGAYSFVANKFLFIFFPFYLFHTIVAFSLLELVNYIEHYGIVRRKKSDGNYEKVEHVHSWNANHLVSNFFLFQLQRHSDHHANAHRRYQVLRHFEDSPQLPLGYPSMILIALFPPLWFKIMNPRLQLWQEQVYAQFPL